MRLLYDCSFPELQVTSNLNIEKTNTNKTFDFTLDFIIHILFCVL